MSGADEIRKAIDLMRKDKKTPQDIEKLRAFRQRMSGQSFLSGFMKGILRSIDNIIPPSGQARSGTLPRATRTREEQETEDIDRRIEEQTRKAAEAARKQVAEEKAREDAAKKVLEKEVGEEMEQEIGEEMTTRGASRKLLATIDKELKDRAARLGVSLYRKGNKGARKSEAKLRSEVEAAERKEQDEKTAAKRLETENKKLQKLKREAEEARKRTEAAEQEKAKKTGERQEAEKQLGKSEQELKKLLQEKGEQTVKAEVPAQPKQTEFKAKKPKPDPSEATPMDMPEDFFKTSEKQTKETRRLQRAKIIGEKVDAARDHDAAHASAHTVTKTDIREMVTDLKGAKKTQNVNKQYSSEIAEINDQRFFIELVPSLREQYNRIIDDILEHNDTIFDPHMTNANSFHRDRVHLENLLSNDNLVRENIFLPMPKVRFTKQDLRPEPVFMPKYSMTEVMTGGEPILSL